MNGLCFIRKSTEVLSDQDRNKRRHCDGGPRRFERRGSRSHGRADIDVVNRNTAAKPVWWRPTAISMIPNAQHRVARAVSCSMLGYAAELEIFGLGRGVSAPLRT